jgi:ATP-dependent Clp protease adaptor protein ClpS
MPKEPTEQPLPDPDDGAGTATLKTPPSAAKVKKAPQRGKVRQLPPYKVLLHNDSVNDMEHVVMSILKVTTLSLADAEAKMIEAHHTGVALLLVTHKERAELYQEQFRTFNLTVTIEPDA